MCEASSFTTENSDLPYPSITNIQSTVVSVAYQSVTSGERKGVRIADVHADHCANRVSTLRACSISAGLEATEFVGQSYSSAESMPL